MSYLSRRSAKWAGLSATIVSLLLLSVVTRSDAQTSETITFAAIGDFGVDDEYHDVVAEMMHEWNPDFIITLGDNRYEEDYDEVIGEEYCDYLSGVESGDECSGGNSAENRFFPSLGNHDYNDGGGLGEYLDYFDLPGNERYYDFVEGPVHFFVLDSGDSSSDGEIDQTQAEWVQNGLENSTADWQIVYFHHAAYSSGEHGSNSGMQKDFAEWGADAVIGAHDHVYERIFQDDIVYFVNGLGGKSLYDFRRQVDGSQYQYNSGYGAMRIVASSSEITFEFRGLDGGDGEVLDTYTIEAGEEPPTTTTTASTTTTTESTTTTIESTTTTRGRPCRHRC